MIASARMQNPPHLGELIRESMNDMGWNVTETAVRLGCERGMRARLLNGGQRTSRIRPPSREIRRRINVTKRPGLLSI